MCIRDRNAAIIEALENDRFDQLGPPVFVRGYLSRYARLLNLPEQAVLDRYRRQSGSSTQEPPPLKVMHPVRRHTRVRDLRGVFYLAVVVAIAWAAIQNLKDLDPSRLFGWWSDGAPAVEKPGESASKTAISQTQYPVSYTHLDVYKRQALVRSQEMAPYVANGTLDAGLTGLDWILETEADVVEIAELSYSKSSDQPARWVLIVNGNSPIQSLEDLAGKRIATELVGFTKRYLAERGVRALSLIHIFRHLALPFRLECQR